MTTETQDKDKPVNVEQMKQILEAGDSARVRTWLDICASCGMCADACFFYLASGKDPKQVPSYKVRTTLGEMFRRKGNVSRAFLEEAKEVLWGKCTMCRRCAQFCPFGIDIATMVALGRKVCRSQDVCPPTLMLLDKYYVETGNQMNMTNEEWIETCEWMAEETAEEMPGLEIPIDKEGAEIMYTVNAREPKYYPQDVAMAAKIFHAAGASWTMPSVGWDDTNMAMFSQNWDVAAMLVKTAYEQAQKLGCKKICITECGHAFRSMKFEGPYFLGLPGGQPPVEVIHAVEVYRDYIRDGKIKIDPAHRLKVPVTYQDPCNVSRNGGLWDVGRELVNYLCEDFRDMSPNRDYNHCCGGGGGFIPMGPEYKRRRMESGKVKAEQIKATGAKIVIVPCHNCTDQINDLNKEYQLGIKVVSFKELITEMMIVPEAPDTDQGGEEEGAE